MSKCLKNYLTYRRIFSRLSIVKTSFSLHSLLENLEVTNKNRIFSLCEKTLSLERAKKNKFSLVLCSLIRIFAAK